jgi:hypothetical protein
MATIAARNKRSCRDGPLLKIGFIIYAFSSTKKGGADQDE